MRKKELPPQQKVFVFFFLYSFSFGAIFPRIADLQVQMGVREGALGMALVGLPLGVQVGLFFADKTLTFLGFRLAVCLGLPILGVSLILASLSMDPVGFFFALIAGGIAVAIIEVAVNLEADRVEYKLGRRIMNRSHSFWSLGFFSAGLIGALLAQAEISPTVHFLGSFTLGSFFVIVFSLRYQVAAIRPNSSTKDSMFVKPTKGVLALVVFTLSAMLIEGAGIDWSVIFMRDIFGTPAFLSGMALFLGSLAQFFVRFYADPVVDRYGPERVAKFSIIAMSLGLLSVCFIKAYSPPIL